MTDREMLELAAKAAGLKIDKTKHSGGGHWNCGFDAAGNAVLDWHNGTKWNPLVDDGDALRLAVRLGIQLLYSDFSGEAEAKWDRGNSRIAEYGPGDPCATARLVVLRAAAEIGKAMP
jgi:hypothetical protein